MSTAISQASLTDRIIDRLARDTGSEGVRRYFGGLASLRFEPEQGRVVNVAVPNAFLADWLGRRYGASLREAARQETGDDGVSLRFRVDPSSSSSAPAARDARDGAGATPPAPIAARPGLSQSDQPASDRLTAPRARRKQPALRRLDQFVVGPGNELAFHGVRRLLDPDCPAGFRQLFVHGECGVGKTHLLQGAVERLRRERPEAKTLYTTGEAFTNGFIAAVRANKIDAFRRKHRGLDLLCIDDVHFLSNKNATQSELLHTFDAIGLDGARILLASDGHPSHIRQFSKELVSRFTASMVVRLDQPERQTRRKIARRLAEDRGLDFHDDAIDAVAGRRQGSVREIEGAMTRIEAMRRLLPDRADGARIDAAFVRRALGDDSPQRAKKPVRIEQIAERVAESLGVELSEMLGKSRHRRVVLARSMTAYLARRLTNYSFPEIANAMGRPNHSTVVTAAKRVEAAVKQGQPLRVGPDLGQTDYAELVERLEREAMRE